ncbi:BsuBI/PstI family type II restriction endonuclease [Geoalkalibacter sp.]|uniref:BsuBI/PstI family type II restriction endonuclease n=1 Tax=Geoalkalibacter sp. TaxID=3041440 RepID=UPI00272E5C4F|nr:BsuBI/PstI family type II restriction endonuclease [Geoalkalibacter sp.]
MFALAPLPEIAEIQRRLEFIFPEGIADRPYVTRESTAKTVFVMLYVDAVQGREFYLSPQHVYRFTQQQCAFQDESSRRLYRESCTKNNYVPAGDRWYADNSREQIRDENLRDGLVSKGAVIVDSSVPTTSNKGRYALREHFARLFLLPETAFEEEAGDWQNHYLSPAELARVRIMRERSAATDAVPVTMPNGERRNLATGGSSLIAKAVIEDFAPRFLLQPAVLWLSESGNHVVLQDDRLMRDLGLPIDQQRLLPDMVLADLGREHTLLVFVEIVYSDGPMTEARKAEILRMTEEAGYTRRNVAFVSAFEQRNAAPLKKRFSGIAVDSLIWCMAEPGLLIWLGETQELPFSPREWP